MICTTIDQYVKSQIKNLNLLWAITLNDGTIVYSDYERPDLENPWIRFRNHCETTGLYPVKIEVIMFGTERKVIFEDPEGLDGIFIVRGAGKDLNLATEECSATYKHLSVGLLRNDEDIIDVRKYCWPKNDFEQFEQTRQLTPDNAKLMFFKNDSRKKIRESVQIALNRAEL